MVGLFKYQFTINYGQIINLPIFHKTHLKLIPNHDTLTSYHWPKAKWLDNIGLLQTTNRIPIKFQAYESSIHPKTSISSIKSNYRNLP